MRDPERIDRILELVQQIWLHDPDMRFMQLIFNLQARYSYENNDAGLVQKLDQDGSPVRGFDFFYLEDNEFEGFLENHLTELQKR